MMPCSSDNALLLLFYLFVSQCSAFTVETQKIEARHSLVAIIALKCGSGFHVNGLVFDPLDPCSSHFYWCPDNSLGPGEVYKSICSEGYAFSTVYFDCIPDDEVCDVMTLLDDLEEGRASNQRSGSCFLACLLGACLGGQCGGAQACIYRCSYG